ncbi:MAG: DUF3473 domain-containing protein [Chlamydiota bacterium]|nr:DUF3473 domain-containing protein [Chlamydiota bacterium]
MINAFTCDVEDYFQVESFKDVIPMTKWDDYPPRVEANTDKVLSILHEKKIKGTFFVLGWIAQRFPSLIHRIADEGHEVASHGSSHAMVTQQTQNDFREDIRRSKKVIEDITGEEVLGYRAPSFSITKDTLWALGILKEEGFIYDSSIFPIKHDRYGIPDAVRFLHSIDTPNGPIWEFPPSTVKFFFGNLPIAGGGYLRAFPMSLLKWGLRKLNKENQPSLIYMHPWELDVNQPRIRTRRLSMFRHYLNLHKTEKKLIQLFNAFEYGRMKDIILERIHESK